MRPTDNDYGSDHPSLHGGLKHHEPLYTDALHNEDVAHEHSDVAVRPLLMFAVGLAVLTGVVMLLMGGLFKAFESNAAKNDPVLSPNAIPAGQLPPLPRIEDNLNEPAVLHKLRETEAKTLAEYAWIDQASGRARLPIAEAKKKLLHDGLPVRADAPTDPGLGSRWAGPTRGESSSGRYVGKPAPAAAEPAPAKPAAPADPHKGHQ